MNKKRYTVRYPNKYGAVITSISNYSELMDLLNGDAKGVKVETKIFENMPKVLHEAIGKHNSEIK